MFLLRALLRHYPREGVLDPDLVVISDLAHAEEIERTDRLDKVSLVLSFLFLGEVNFWPLQVRHLVDMHDALDVDADEHLLTSLRRFDELCEDQNRFLSELLQCLPRVLSIRALRIDHDLLDLVLGHNHGYRAIAKKDMTLVFI